MAVEGSSIPSEYVRYGAKINWLKVDNDNMENDSVEDNNIPMSSLDITNIKGTEINNLFNKTTSTPLKYVDNTGAILDSVTLLLSDYIPVKENMDYVVSDGYTSQGGVYDKDKNWIDKVTPGTPGLPWSFKVPKNGAYVRLNVHQGILDQWMTVPGTVYPSDYKAYGVYLPFETIIRDEYRLFWGFHYMV
jgi:hypothetical protein